MGFLDKLVLPPSAEHLTLVKYLLVLVYLIHIPFISMLMGGAFFSIAFNLSDKGKRNANHRRFARELIDTFAYRKSVGLILGVIPLLTLFFVYAQILYNADLLLFNTFLPVILLVAVGLVLIYVYQRSFDSRDKRFSLHIGSGVLGTLLLFVAYLIFVSGTSLIMDPEKWTAVRSPYGILFSWNVVARYIFFMMTAFAATGGGILFFFLKWKQPDDGQNQDYRGFVRRFGAGLALIFVLTQPVFILWGLVTSPRVALSTAVFSLSAMTLFLLLLLSLKLYSVLRSSDTKPVTHTSVLFLLLFLAIFIGESASREYAIQEHTQGLITRAEEAKAEIMLARGIEGGGETDTKRGESVFKQRCSTCHSFDKRLVGPPLNTVLPMYLGKAEELVAFIRNPTKMSPAYPAMPKLGLKEIEIEAVAEYVLSQIDSELEAPPADHAHGPAGDTHDEPASDAHDEPASDAHDEPAGDAHDEP